MRLIHEIKVCSLYPFVSLNPLLESPKIGRFGALVKEETKDKDVSKMEVMFKIMPPKKSIVEGLGEEEEEEELSPLEQQIKESYQARDIVDILDKSLSVPLEMLGLKYETADTDLQMPGSELDTMSSWPLNTHVQTELEEEQGVNDQSDNTKDDPEAPEASAENVKVRSFRSSPMVMEPRKVRYMRLTQTVFVKQNAAVLLE